MVKQSYMFHLKTSEFLKRNSLNLIMFSMATLIYTFFFRRQIITIITTFVNHIGRTSTNFSRITTYLRVVDFRQWGRKSSVATFVTSRYVASSSNHVSITVSVRLVSNLWRQRVVRFVRLKSKGSFRSRKFVDDLWFRPYYCNSQHFRVGVYICIEWSLILIVS